MQIDTPAGVIDFPDDMPPEQIEAVLREKFAYTQPGQSAAEDDAMGVSAAGVDMPTEYGRTQALRHAAQGATFKMSDEMEAAMTGKDVDQIRREMDAYAQARLGAASTAELVGSLYNPAMLAGKLPGVSKVAEKVSPFVTAPVAGGAFGGLYAYGGTTDETQDVTGEVTRGMGYGAAFGLGGQTLVKLAEPVMGAAAKVFGHADGKPTIQKSQKAHKALYDVFHKSGVEAKPQQLVALRDRIEQMARQEFYDPNIDKVTKSLIERVNKLVQNNEPVPIADLDKLRSVTFGRASTAKFGSDKFQARNGASLIDDTIDEVIEASPLPDNIALVAREQYKQTRKMQQLQEAFDKANRKNTKTLTAYRSAVNNILDNPQKRRFFTEEELAAMRKFAEGGMGQSIMSFFGGFKPSANGLLQILQIGAVSMNPQLATLGGVGYLADLAQSKGTQKKAQELVEMMGGYKKPEPTRFPAAPAGYVGSEQ